MADELGRSCSTPQVKLWKAKHRDAQAYGTKSAMIGTSKPSKRRRRVCGDEMLDDSSPEELVAELEFGSEAEESDLDLGDSLSESDIM